MLSYISTVRAFVVPIKGHPVTSTLLLKGKVSGVGQTSIRTAATWAKTRKTRYRDAVQALRQLKINGKLLPLFENYQIKALNVSTKLKELLILLNDTSPSVGDYQTRVYPKVVKELRELTKKISLNQSSSTSLEIGIVKHLCYLHFTLDIKSSDIGFSYVKNLFTRGFSAKFLNPSKLDKSLSSVFRKRSLGTKITDLKRRLSSNIDFVSWDPSAYSIRSSFSTMKVDGKDVHFLRMACPVVGLSGKPQIDPLFKGYLSSLKDTDCHLYVNNLSHDKKSDHRRNKFLRAPVGLEFKRSEKLKELSLDSKYSNKFKLITLPHDSDFYRQKKTPKIMKSSDFIDAFVKNVEGNLQGFYFPDTLNKKQLGELVRGHLNKILSEQFFGKKELTLEDRRRMIQIAYSDITKSFLNRWDITHCNITCKDGVDRAMGSLANLQVRLNPETSVDQIVYTLVTAATLNHARPPKASRVKRSLASINTIIESAKT